MSSKSKGTRYERELVHMCQDVGIGAYRVPMSGSLSGFSSACEDDVVIDDYGRIEVKYRRRAEGFSRFYDWIGDADGVWLEASGLIVLTWRAWSERVLAIIDERDEPTLDIVEKAVSAQRTVIGWMGEADVLACRKAGTRYTSREDLWLFCERTRKGVEVDDE